MWIDSHCHLNHERLKEIGSVENIINNAKAAGTDGMLTISCRIHEEFETLKKITEKHDNIWRSIGTHPHDAGKDAEKSVTLDELIKLAKSDSKIIAIGESGLDYYYDYAPRDDQAESFRKHIQTCIATDLPLIVHARDADEDIIKILKEEGAGTNLKGVMHCFSSGRKMAEEALEIGFYISLSGILTFKQSDDLRAIARDVPMDRLLVETDAPYLAPGPYRGKINQPAYVIETGATLGQVKGVSVEEIAAQTTKNFFALFDKAHVS